MDGDQPRMDGDKPKKDGEKPSTSRQSIRATAGVPPARYPEREELHRQTRYAISNIGALVQKHFENPDSRASSKASSFVSTKSTTSSILKKKMNELETQRKLAALDKQERDDQRKLILLEQEVNNLQVDEGEAEDSDEERTRGHIPGLDEDEEREIADFEEQCKSAPSFPHLSASAPNLRNLSLREEESAFTVADYQAQKVADYQAKKVADYRAPEVADCHTKKVADGHQQNVADYHAQKIAEFKAKEAAEAEALKIAEAKKLKEMQRKATQDRIAEIKLKMEEADAAAEMKRKEWALIENEKIKLEKEAAEAARFLSAQTQPTVTVDLSQTDDNSLNPPASNPVVSQLVQALTQALGNANSGSSSTDKFLARQTHGKELPFFSGRPEEWTGFLRSFEDTTRICEFTNADNIIRLRKCLKGEALKNVQCLLTIPENVPIIMKMLEGRFGQPTHIIATLIAKAKAVPAVKEGKLETVIDLGVAVQNLTSTVRALRPQGTLEGLEILPVLENKLTDNMKMQWSQWISSTVDKKQNLDRFAEWIGVQMSSAWRMCPPKVMEESRKSGDQQKGKKWQEAVCVTTELPEKKKVPDGKKDFKQKEKKCNFCSKPGHKLADCRGFAKENVSARVAFVKEKRLCFGCINFGHGFKECRSKKKCSEEGCEKEHHTLLHLEDTKVQTPEKENEHIEHVSQVGRIMHIGEDQILYQVLPVILKGPNKEIQTYAMMDPGSAYTVIDASLAKELGLSGVSKTLEFQSLAEKSVKVPSNLVDLDIINPRSKESYPLKRVRTFSNLNLPAKTIKKSQIQKWKHLKGLDIKPYKDAQPKILIGLPHSHLTVHQKVIKSPPNAPSAVETKLGWMLFGQIPGDLTTEVVESIMHISNEEGMDSLHQLVKSRFATEDFGVKPNCPTKKSQAEERAVQIMDSCMKKVEGRYETPLLWKSDDLCLPESRQNALRRLYSWERKMEKDPETAEQYCRKMEHYEKSGYIKQLTPEELQFDGKRVWYLPHFGVYNQKKPGKLRLVFDAAAKANGTSLNSNLLPGPDTLKPLPSVLFKFRQRKIAITGDIKEMFHQVKVREEDQQSQRLLWRGAERDKPPKEYKMTVMTFGSTCSPYCAQEAKNRNAKEWEVDFPEAANAIVNNHYVDDYLDSCDTEHEAYIRFRDVCEVHKRGGFHICNWTTNSRRLVKQIPPEMRADSQKKLDCEKESFWTERILGLAWDPSDDCFTFTANLIGIKKEIVSREQVPTKREALSLIMSVFDPLGFVAHLTIKAKIILQETWRSKIGWDDELPSSIHLKWKTWIEELHQIGKCRIPRCYSSSFSSTENMQLHIFCDASESAFAAVGYFRVEKGDKVDVTIACAKIRVAPLKPLSIPRLELQAAVMGSRLALTLTEGHDFKPKKTYFWTDSRTVMCWIRSDGKTFHPFVSHRIGEIQELTDVNSWRWIPTNENVADEATRDNKPCDWEENSRWINGPAFLKSPEENWPKEKVSHEEVKSDDLELKKEFIAVVRKDPKKNIDLKENPNEIRRFSNWTRLLRATVRIIRLFQGKALRKVLNPLEVREMKNKVIDVQEARKAEVLLWIWSQRESFPGYELLENGRPLCSSSLTKYNPFIDHQGLMRMRGRVQADIEVPEMEKNPIILSAKHPFIATMIQSLHEKLGHHGQDKLANDLKMQFCIPMLRRAVRKTWNDCQLCKNRRILPKPPMMGEIPKARLAIRQPPFTETGLDYFGPMEVAVGRRREKRYGALFICLTTRAVHMEIAASLNTDSCIMAIRRFISRRGEPHTIYSDNGTNFVGANNELKREILKLDQDKIKNAMTVKGIQWNWSFIPQSSPHMGGSWERMVKAIKTALASSLKEKVPQEEVLQTLIIEAENMVNGRPLVHVSSDPEDPPVITPNHFLLLRPNHVPPPGKFDNSDLFLRRQWKTSQRLCELFWEKWVKEYLSTLTLRKKWHKDQTPVKVGDIVRLAESNLVRNQWPLGRVTAVHPGPDGIIRVVDVKTATGVYRRPMAKVCILDVGVKDSTVTDGPSSEIVDLVGKPPKSGGGMSLRPRKK